MNILKIIGKHLRLALVGSLDHVAFVFVLIAHTVSIIYICLFVGFFLTDHVVQSHTFYDTLRNAVGASLFTLIVGYFLNTNEGKEKIRWLVKQIKWLQNSRIG